MFDKLEELVGRLEEINMMLTEPEVINDQKSHRISGRPVPRRLHRT